MPFIIGILTQVGIENYGLKVGIIQKIFVNIADFSCVIFLSPNCADTSRLKFVDTFRPKFDNSSLKQYI